MHRRRYLAGVGGSIAALPTARAGTNAVEREGRFERVRPEDSVTVRPETTVLFEASVPEGTEPTDIEWETDAESGSLLGTEYDVATGNAARSPTFESPGTYDVRASYGVEGIAWAVTVTDDAPERPIVEELWTEPDDGTVGVDDTVDVTATVADPAGDLDGVVWTEGRNMTVYDTESVDGDRETVTLPVEGGSHWLSAGYPTVVSAVTADGRLSEPASVGGPDVRQPFEVEIVGTNAPVAAGDDLDVEVELTHDGEMMMVGPNEQEIRLVVGDETVDAETVALDWNEVERLTLGYGTYPVERDVEFPVRVECEDDADETTVSVYADEPGGRAGELDVSITTTDAPVTGGEQLSVRVSVSNDGTADASGEVQLVVGGEVVDSRTVGVPGETARTIGLGYETYPVRQDVTVDLTVRSEHDEDHESVTVYGTDG